MKKSVQVPVERLQMMELMEVVTGLKFETLVRGIKRYFVLMKTFGGIAMLEINSALLILPLGNQPNLFS